MEQGLTLWRKENNQRSQQHLSKNIIIPHQSFGMKRTEKKSLFRLFNHSMKGSNSASYVICCERCWIYNDKWNRQDSCRWVYNLPAKVYKIQPWAKFKLTVVFGIFKRLFNRKIKEHATKNVHGYKSLHY